MPKVISYTPPWLSRPEPGFDLFTSSQGTLSSPQRERRGSGQQSNGDMSKQYLGPKKIIAQRGTEVFVVADNQIRWSDLCLLKDDYDEREEVGQKALHRRTSGQSAENGGTSSGKLDQTSSYRVLQVNISEKIRQLLISPNGRLLAIVTSHTIHIAILPNPSKLGQDDKPIRLNTRMLARTIHVLGQSPIRSALWHPCGVDGSCLVTVTADAVVRLWELNFQDHMSFDTPSLAIDLKKLAVGTSADQDFRPNRPNANRSFSLDSIGMDVASACFGGSGSSEESAWCAMTLWIAMGEGDVYALCPLLPSKWQPSSTVIPSLSAQAVSRMASVQESSLSPAELQQCNDQYEWVTDLDSQDPYSVHADNGILPGAEVYSRPFSPSPVPKLQGPFQVFGEEYDQDLEISDVHVIAATVDAKELVDGEDSETDSGLGMDDDIGLAASVVCMITTSGRVYVCLDIDGVQAQWLPTRRNPLDSTAEEPSLVLFETIDTMKTEHAQVTEWPTFSLDVDSRYSFFITHSQGVYYLSLETWIQGLQSELQSTASVGTTFRIDIITNGPGTFRERVLDFQQDHEPAIHEPTAAVILQDSDLGYFLLTAVNGAPQAVVLDKPDAAIDEELRVQTTYTPPVEANMPALGPARQPYVPPPSLWKQSTLPRFFSTHVQNRHKKTLKEEIRLSSATLDLMTQAHRVLSEETHTLGLAAADLFRRCERLQDELRDQIERVKEVVKRTEEAVGVESEDDSGDERPKAAVEQRLEDAKARQEKLMTRFEDLSRKVRKCNLKPYSDQERALFAEVDKINRSVSEPDNKQENGEEQHLLEIWQRYDEAKRLAADMVARAKESSDNMQANDGGNDKVPPDLRKAKVGQVMGLLERESALVDAASERLERLSLATLS